MNFIEAVKKFYEGLESGERIFVTRKSWCRSWPGYDDAYFHALALDSYRNLRAFKIDSHGNFWCHHPGNVELMSPDYLADDWAVFDIDQWKIQEDENEKSD
jgi:hypothetical protein